MGKTATKQPSPVKSNITFSDTLLESSNPDRLVEYLRAKRNLPRPHKELFSNDHNDKPRKSFQLELKPYQKENTINEVPIEETSDDILTKNDKQTNNSPQKTRLPRVLLHNGLQLEKNKNAKKSLLQEFEMTIQQNEFQPPVFSTPFNSEIQPQQKLINDLTLDNKTTCNNKGKKNPILKIKPLSASELEAAKLIEQLERERNEINVTNIRKTNKHNNTGEIDDNIEKHFRVQEIQQHENLNSDLLEKSQSQLSQDKNQKNENIEINESNRNKSQRLTQCKLKNAISTSETEHSINENIILQVPESEGFSDTEEFETENVVIPETQESQTNIDEICGNSQPLSVNENMPEHLNRNKGNQFLPPKSPSRRTFTVHNLDKTLTPSRHQNELSPKLVKPSSSSQMSPLARRAQSQLHAENNAKISQRYLQSKIPKIIRNESIQKNSNHKYNLNKSPLKGINESHIEEYININDKNLMENLKESSANIVVPIYQTVNISKNVPEQTIISSPIPEKTVASISEQTIVSSPIPPPTEYCDKTITKSPIQNKNSTHLKHKSNNGHVVRLISSDEEIIHIPSIVNNELLTDDEDISSQSFKFVKNISNKNLNKKQELDNKIPINNIKNKTILQNKSFNETIKAIDLRIAKKSSKRKSSRIANHNFDKKVKVVESCDCRVENKFDNEINSTNEQNNGLRELLTPRYTPPPPILVHDDLPEAYSIYNIENEEQNDNSSVESNNTCQTNCGTSIYKKRQNETDLNENFKSKSPRKDQDFLETEKRSYNFRSNPSITESACVNKQNNTTKSRKIEKNKLNLSNKRRSHKTAVINLNNIADKNENDLQSFVDVTDIQVTKEIENEINCENYNINEKLGNTKVSRNLVNTSNKRGRNERNSPILSRHASLSFLKTINFNKKNYLQKSKKNEDETVEQKKTYRERKSRSRSRKPTRKNTNPENKNLSSSPDKTNLINIVDTNIDSQLVVDNPKAMNNFWRNSIANRSKVSDKKDKDDTLKQFYLNVDKTINNHQNMSTISIRRKLYSKGQSDVDLPPLSEHTPNKTINTTNVNNNLTELSTNITNNKRKHKKKSMRNNNTDQIIDNIRADWNDINEIVVQDDENPNHSTDLKENEKLILNNCDKEKSEKSYKKTKKKNNVGNKTNNIVADTIFKIPNLPVLKSSRKNKQSDQQNMVTINNKTAQKQQPEVSSGGEQNDFSSRFGTPRRTSTKFADNIEKDLNGKTKTKRIMVMSIDDNSPVDDCRTNSVESTTTYRRSRRKPCPRRAYWTNDRIILDDPFSIISEEKHTFKKKKTRNKKIPTIIEEEVDEIAPEPQSNIEDDLTELVDMIRENLSVIEENYKIQNSPDEKLPDVNKSKKKTKEKSNKRKKKMNDQIKDNKTDIAEPPIPSTSKEVAAAMPSTSNINNQIDRVNEETVSTNIINYDSGNGTDIYQNKKDIDKFSWLRKLVSSNTSTSKSNSNMIVERLVMGKDFELASFNSMTPVEKDNVEYYFSSSSSAHNFGFMKLKPNSVKLRSKLKHSDINFILFSDELQFTIGEECLKSTKAGEVVVVKKNKHYSIANETDTDGLLLFLKTIT